MFCSSRWASRVTALLLFLVSGFVRAAPPVTIINAEFGIFEIAAGREVDFVPTREVPHVEGQRYGWMIELNTTRRSVAVREEYLLAPDKEISAADNRIDIPLPRRNQVSQRQLVPVGRRIVGEWAVGPREPPGKRHLQVIVEGELAGDFQYEVK
jgi:hypothetical protein